MNKTAYVQGKLTDNSGRIGKLVSIDGNMVTFEVEANELFQAETITLPASFLTFVSEWDYKAQRAQIESNIAAKKVAEAQFDDTFGFMFEKGQNEQK